MAGSGVAHHLGRLLVIGSRLDDVLDLWSAALSTFKQANLICTDDVLGRAESEAQSLDCRLVIILDSTAMAGGRLEGLERRAVAVVPDEAPAAALARLEDAGVLALRRSEAELCLATILLSPVAFARLAGGANLER